VHAGDDRRVALTPISYALQFRGRAEQQGRSSDRLAATTRAPSCELRSTVDDDGVHASFEAIDDCHAICRSRVLLSDDRTFEETGSISFGNGNTLYFHTIGTGILGPSPDPDLRHGSCVREVVGGQGRFARAEGRITSNFLLSSTGEITDTQVGVIFVAGQPRHL
jgi:hypothetical protein